MSQCVPSWDLEENSKVKLHSKSLLPDVPDHSVDYEVAELTWVNGQLAMHGLGVPRVAYKPTAWDKPRAGGTLESIVNQATAHPQPKSAVDGGITNVPWLNPAATMDALVPCNNQEPSTHVQELGIRSTVVGSCSGAVPTMDGGAGGPRVRGSMSESGETETHQVTLGISISMPTPENTQDNTNTSAEDHFISQTRSQRKTGDEEGKRKLNIGNSSGSTKRSRAAAIHNQSERKRRDKINQRMKTLQKLVPNSSKADKVSMLDEVIDYLKQLQAHVHMMNMRMNMSSMMLPLAMQQQLQMSMMGMGMGMGVMDMNAINRAAAAAPPPVIPPATAFMPTPWDNPAECLPTLPAGLAMPDPLAALFARQSQPMTMDAYSMLAAMYQQMQQPPAS